MENNVRLIDANALIKHYSCVEAQKSSAEKIRAEIIVQALENAPTIIPKSLQPVGRNDREKLIKLIQSAVDGCAEYWAGLIADHLIASGVTFATDTNDGGKWIPVTERLPENTGRYLTANIKADDQICVFDLWFDCGEWYVDESDEWFMYKVTHWMPLPEPPKGEPHEKT